MTGETILTGNPPLRILSTNYNHIVIQQPTSERGQALDSDKLFGLTFFDKDNLTMGRLWCNRPANSLVKEVSMQAINSNNQMNTLATRIDDEGNYSYTVSSPYAFRQAINTINKDGDTIFNQLSVEAAVPYYILKVTQVDASSTSNGVSTTIWPALIWHDKEGKTIGRVETAIYNNGTIGSYWYVKNYNTSGESLGQKGISIAFQKNGTITYGVDEPSAFRKAIQVDSFWTISRVDASISKAYGSSVNVTAPTVSGYTFFCWIYFNTQGWVGTVYSANIISNPTTVWNSYNGGSGTGTINCYALYKRN